MATAQNFTFRLALGLVGILLASLMSGVGERVTQTVLNDMLGHWGLGHDEGSWLTTAYSAAEASMMLLAGWLAVVLSLRRFAIGACLALGLFSLLVPLADSYPLMIGLRIAQGLAAGSILPLLMMAALRFLPWHSKLYGLAAYALTATFGPYMSVPLAALWGSLGDWDLVFWESIPVSLLSAALVSFGIPQDPVRLERFRQFDWFGSLLGVGAMSLLVVGMTQGERLGWGNSRLIWVLMVTGVALFIAFLAHEWSHPMPLYKLQLLGRRNFAFGILTLCLFMFLVLPAGAIPAGYLTSIQGYRPLELFPVSLTMALPQLALVPLTATLINRKTVDSRYVMAIGFLLIIGSCLLGSQLTSEWNRDNFTVLQLLQTLGQPFIVVPLLLNATAVVDATEGPFATGMVNSLRALFTVIATTLYGHFMVERQALHGTRLTESIGAHGNDATGLLAPSQLANLQARIAEQAAVMSYADAYLALIPIALLLLLLVACLPHRAYPPQPPSN
uniref:MFS transporter n=1 Tax=uncultured Halomonas sp. TaxID=173971 RepID=UPI002626D21C|nr:MFS transporter [uncultured Halomonas sp.]